MKKKLFFCSIPMLPADNLIKLRYRKESQGELFSDATSFPSIAMLEWNILGTEEVKIVAIKTDDDAGRTAANFVRFKEELKQFSDENGFNLSVDSEITLPHDESREKQIELFRAMTEAFEENCEVYMDITYGTKVTSIGLFSSLVYAEKAYHCDVKSVIYGKYSHAGGNIGDYFDVRCMYDMAMLINTVDYLPKQGIDAVIETLWGKKNG